MVYLNLRMLIPYVVSLNMVYTLSYLGNKEGCIYNIRFGILLGVDN